MDLYRTAALALDALVARDLQPQPEFVGAARRALGTLDAALRERRGRQGPKVLKTARVSRGRRARWPGAPRSSAQPGRRLHAHRADGETEAPGGLVVCKPPSRRGV